MEELNLENPEEGLHQLTEEQISKLEGKYDEDGFYHLKEGGFYDPLGFYYNKEGKDEHGGYYDEAGYYVKPKGSKF